MNFGENWFKKYWTVRFLSHFYWQHYQNAINSLSRETISDTTKSHENINCLCWNLLHINTWLSSTHTINFSSNGWVIGILWIPQFVEKSVFWATFAPHISRSMKIETWNFEHKHISMLPNYHINFSSLEQSIHAGQLKEKSIFRQKVNFWPRFSHKKSPNFFIHLFSFKDHTVVYNLA